MAMYDFASMSMYNIEKFINEEDNEFELYIDSNEDASLTIRDSKCDFKNRDIGFDSGSYKQVETKTSSGFNVEPVLLIKRDFDDNGNNDSEEMIIPDTNIRGPKPFVFHNQANKTVNDEEIPKCAPSESKHISKGCLGKNNPDTTEDVKIEDSDDDSGEIIYLSISDDESEDGEEKEIKIKSVEISANVEKPHTQNGLNKDKLDTDDQVIYISDDEDVNYSPVNETRVPLSETKSSPKSSFNTIAPSQSQSLSSSDDDGYDSDDQIIFFLNNQESSSDEDENTEDNECNDNVGVDDHLELSAQQEEGSKMQINNDSEHTSVRRTTRRKTAVKTKCPCCTDSTSHDMSLKEEHAKVKRKASCNFELSRNINEATNKKRKLSNSVSVKNNRGSKENKNHMKKMVTEVVARTDNNTNSEYYSCPTCNYMHQSKDELTVHWREKHSVTGDSINEIYELLKMAVDNRKCKTCQKMLEENDNINKHIMWHSKSNKLIEDCILCSMLFNKLNSHIRNHAPYVCRLCVKGFTNDIDLNKHLITHLYDNSEQGTSKHCKLCTKTFNSIYDNVLEHLVMHHSDYNFVTTDDLLNYKVKISTADLNEYKIKRQKIRKVMPLTEPKYICIHCTMTYNNINGFVRHLKNNHNVARQECKSCNIHFESPKELHDHIRKKHKDINESFSCPGCRRMFTDVIAFRTHFKRHGEHEIHSYNCPICSSVLYNLFSLKRHLLVHTGEKPFQCDKCELKFRDQRNLMSHMKAIHSTTHDLICSVCNQTFSCKEYLKRHMKTRHCKIV